MSAAAHAAAVAEPAASARSMKPQRSGWTDRLGRASRSAIVGSGDGLAPPTVSL